MLTNLREQLTRTKGFRHVVIAASRPCLLLFAAERVRSDSNDRDRAQRWIGFNAARGGITVHDRELDIHQDKVGPLLCYRGKRLLAVFDFGNLIVCRGQHIADDLAIIRLILNHQDAFAHAEASTCRSTITGSVNANVEPCPGCDSTQIRPPCISMMRLEMASPKPVPPFLRVIALSACWNS